MKLEILAAESLGVRGLCCRVQAADRAIVIDPGLALGEMRHGLPPHPVQIAEGRAARRRIVEALEAATDVVFSHYHGDHVPLSDANPYQLAFVQLPARCAALRAWSLSPGGQTEPSQRRARELMQRLGSRWQVARGLEGGPLRFSPPVPHCVLAAGPPLYRRGLDARQREHAWANASRLAANVETPILDHHLLRSLDGEDWLARLAQAVGRRVDCAADFMARPRQLLEARRCELYAAMPVRPGWHEAYARGSATIEDFAPSGAAPGSWPPDRSLAVQEQS
jgi:hypothetical protein